MRPHFFCSGLIFLAVLAEESSRELAVVAEASQLQQQQLNANKVRDMSAGIRNSYLFW
jgi:hypothetical protein